MFNEFHALAGGGGQTFFATAAWRIARNAHWANSWRSRALPADDDSYGKLSAVSYQLTGMNPDPANRRKIFLIVLLILVPVLFLLGWSQASLNLGFIRPTNF